MTFQRVIGDSHNITLQQKGPYFDLFLMASANISSVNTKQQFKKTLLKNLVTATE